MNPNRSLWKLLLGLGGGTAAATYPEESEAVFLPTDAIKRIVSPDTFSGLIEQASKIKRQAPFMDEARMGRGILPNLAALADNQDMFLNSGKRFFVDNAGNLRMNAINHYDYERWSDILGPMKIGDEIRYRDLVDPSSDIARAAPEFYNRSTIRIGDDPRVSASFHYDPFTTPETMRIELMGGGAGPPGGGGWSNIGKGRKYSQLFDSTEHETEHGIDALFGTPGGASPTWFKSRKPHGAAFNGLSEEQLYKYVLGEQMGRAAGATTINGFNPLREMARQHLSWIPEEATDQYGRELWRTKWYDNPWPHDKARLGYTDTKTADSIPSIWSTTKEVGKAVADPENVMDLMAGLALPASLGLGVSLGLIPRTLGSGTLDDMTEEDKEALRRYNMGY